MTEGHDVDNADAKWLCPECHTVDEAWAAASSSVLFVAPSDKLALVVAELERRLPAHFLGLKKAYPDRRRVLRSSTDGRASRAMRSAACGCSIMALGSSGQAAGGVSPPARAV